MRWIILRSGQRIPKLFFAGLPIIAVNADAHGTVLRATVRRLCRWPGLPVTWAPGLRVRRYHQETGKQPLDLVHGDLSDAWGDPARSKNHKLAIECAGRV